MNLHEDEKYIQIGLITKVLLDLHLENPKDHNATTILEILFTEYEKIGFDKEDESND